MKSLRMILAVSLAVGCGKAFADDPRLAHIPNYGKYCGSGYSAGHSQDHGPDICRPGAQLPEPDDSLDELCYRHDLGYCSSDADAIIAADKRLVEALTRLSGDPRRWAKKPKCEQEPGQLRGGALNPRDSRRSPRSTLTPSCLDAASGYRRMALRAFQAKVAQALSGRYLNESLSRDAEAQPGQVRASKVKPRRRP